MSPSASSYSEKDVYQPHSMLPYPFSWRLPCHQAGLKFWPLYPTMYYFLFSYLHTHNSMVVLFPPSFFIFYLWTRHITRPHGPQPRHPSHRQIKAIISHNCRCFLCFRDVSILDRPMLEIFRRKKLPIEILHV